MTATQVQFNASTRFFTIATAGHVDHGKTSLLRRLTGIDPDRLKEEKERQMTTDLGFAYLPLDSNLVLGFVDVPGHGKFLKNMLAGVGGIDLALLVVAADEGPMPQTRQHVRILSMLGVSRALVAVTKIDLLQDREEIELVIDDTREMLEAHGIKALDFIPISSSSGEGFEVLQLALKNVLSELPERDLRSTLFLPVDRVFSKAGFGTVITGTVVSGKIAVGDQLFIEPGDISARVRRLETHGQTVNEAHPGQRVACNLVIKEGEKLSRGFVLTGAAISPSRSLIVSLSDRPRLLTQPLSERLSDQPIRLYHGTAEYQGYLRWVEDEELDAAENSKYQQGLGFVALQDDGVLSAQDKFVIRLTDDTIYGGSILLRDRPKWLSKGEILQLARMLDKEQFAESLKLFLDEAPAMMLREAQLSMIIPESILKIQIEQGLKDGSLLRLSEFILSKDARKTLKERLLHALTELLALPENEEGANIEVLRQKLQPKIERIAYQALIEEESTQNSIVRKGEFVLLPGTTSSKAASPALAEAEQKVLAVLDNCWCLELDEIAQQSGLDLKTVKSVVNKLTKAEELVVASFDFIARKSKIDEAHQVLADLWTAKRSIAPTDFKEKIGVTRKYAMALLQYFDDNKITRRLESGRVLLKGPTRR